jgi:hypothetical protein
MDWTTPFVIYRIDAEGKLEEVYHAGDIKMAKYWLQYIAQPGDVLCKTPKHPKHSKSSGRPEYWSHKEQSGTPATNEDAWRANATRLHFSGEFPEHQLKNSSENQ